jgi:hypothetical integral membrane protein (TIGR02206 family)
VNAGSVEHIAALVATAGTAALVVWGARRGGDALVVPVGRVLGVVILAAYAAEHVTYALRGDWSVELNLPLHLTDAVTLTAIAALWRPTSLRLVELVYFWALTASVQAVLTPDLAQGFPDVLFVTYFATHFGAIVAACLLVFGARHTPRPGAVRRMVAITLGFTMLSALGTILTGGNYMYLRHKPPRRSLLDVMGPWPVYILAAAGVAVLMFLVLAGCARRIARSGGHDHVAPRVA